MSFLGRVLDPAGVTRGRGSRAFTDPANLQGRGGRGLTGGQPGQPTQPVPQGMGGGRAGVRPGLIAGYADGGKVYDRKPNGKRC